MIIADKKNGEAIWAVRKGRTEGGFFIDEETGLKFCLTEFIFRTGYDRNEEDALLEKQSKVDRHLLTRLQTTSDAAYTIASEIQQFWKNLQTK